jgi:hypothetical protein
MLSDAFDFDCWRRRRGLLVFKGGWVSECEIFFVKDWVDALPCLGDI